MRNRTARTGGVDEQAVLALEEPLAADTVFTGRAVRDAEGRVDMAWFEAARTLMAARDAAGRCSRCGGDRGERLVICARCRSRCMYGCGTPAPEPLGLGETWLCGSAECEAAWQKERRRCSWCGRSGGIVSGSGGPTRPCEIHNCGACLESRTAARRAAASA